MKQSNTPQLWDHVWDQARSEEESKQQFRNAKKTSHWRRIERVLLDKFGTLKKLKSIELGAGAGRHSLILASKGADVTILDYSKKAIEASKALFKANGLDAKFILIDAFDIKENLISKFDISMSFGTAEHFSGKKRIEFINLHFKVLKKGGVAFISVPNKWHIFYRIHKFLSESFGKWKFGEEYPFSVIEFKKIGRKNSHKFEFVGQTIFSDPFLISLRIKKFLGFKKCNLLEMKKEIGTPVDKYFGKSITAIARK